MSTKVHKKVLPLIFPDCYKISYAITLITSGVIHQYNDSFHGDEDDSDRGVVTTIMTTVMMAMTTPKAKQ